METTPAASASSWDNLPPEVRARWQKLATEASLPPSFLESATGRLTEESYDPRKIAELAESDPVLGTKLLAVANSAAFGLVQPVSSIQRAVVHLGMRLVESVILSYQLEASFASYASYPQRHLEFARMWSAATSVLALHMAKPASGLDEEVLSTAGLLSRLGTLLFGLAEPRPTDAYLDCPNEVERLRHELATWQITSALLGALALDEYNVPDPLPRLCGRASEPLLSELLDSDDDAPALIVLASAQVMAVRFMEQRRLIPGIVLDEEPYHFLRENIFKYDLYDAVTGVLNSKVARRELEGACHIGG